MNKKLPSSRLLFNEMTLNIHLIIGTPDHEKWITITYENDLWYQFMHTFSGQEITNIIKQLKSSNSLAAIRVAKKALNISLKDAKDLIDNLAN